MHLEWDDINFITGTWEIKISLIALQNMESAGDPSGAKAKSDFIPAFNSTASYNKKSAISRL